MGEKEKDKVSEEELEKTQKEVRDAIDETTIEQALKNNEIVFEMDGQKYRVRKPTFHEKQEAHKLRVKKFTELLQNDDYLLESNLKTLYKKRGVDLDEMDAKLVRLEQKKQDILSNLGKSIKDGREDQKTDYKEQILDITSQQTAISIEKTQLLQYSIETQVTIHVYSYLSYLVSEKQQKDNTWKRIFKSYDEFEGSEGPLQNKIVMLAALMIKHELSLE